jgi:hypothetical protein
VTPSGKAAAAARESGDRWTIQMWLPSGSAIENISGAPPISVGGLVTVTPSIADSRSCSAWTSGVSTPIAPPPGSSRIGGLSARRVVDPGGATSSQRISPFSPKRSSPRTSQPSFSL